MVLRVECSHCGREYRLRNENAGKRLRCKKCGKAFVVPDDPIDDYEDSWEDGNDYGDSYADSYGDDYGDDESSLPPRTGKSRKSSSRRRRKAGIPAGVKVAIFSCVGVVAVGLLGWGAVTLGVKLFAVTHESLIRETLDLTNDLADIFEDVEDKDSAEAAGPKIVALGERIAEAYKREIELNEEEPISKEEKKRLKEKYEKQVEKAQQRAQDEMKRIAGIPEALAELRDPLKAMSEAIREVRLEQRKAQLEAWAKKLEEKRAKRKDLEKNKVHPTKAYLASWMANIFSLKKS